MSKRRYFDKSIDGKILIQPDDIDIDELLTAIGGGGGGGADLPPGFAAGDLLGTNTGASLVRIPIGAVGSILTPQSPFVNNGGLQWVQPSALNIEPKLNLANGDLVYGNNGTAKLGIGTNGHVLTIAAGLPTWAAPTGGGGGGVQNPMQSALDCDTFGLLDCGSIGFSGGILLTSATAQPIRIGFNIAATTSPTNTIVGQDAGSAITTATNITLIGREAGRLITGASQCTVVGSRCAPALTTGNSNTFVGYECAVNITNGSLNCFFGRNCGVNTSSTGRTCIFGADNGTFGNNVDRSICVGYGNTLQTNNCIVLGTQCVTNNIYQVIIGHDIAPATPTPNTWWINAGTVGPSTFSHVMGFNSTTGQMGPVTLSFQPSLNLSNGDIVYGNNGTAKLPVGTNSQVLTVSNGLPAWADPAGGGTGDEPFVQRAQHIKTINAGNAQYAMLYAFQFQTDTMISIQGTVTSYANATKAYTFNLTASCLNGITTIYTENSTTNGVFVIDANGNQLRIRTHAEPTNVSYLINATVVTTLGDCILDATPNTPVFATIIGFNTTVNLQGNLYPSVGVIATGPLAATAITSQSGTVGTTWTYTTTNVQNDTIVFDYTTPLSPTDVLTFTQTQGQYDVQETIFNVTGLAEPLIDPNTIPSLYLWMDSTHAPSLTLTNTDVETWTDRKTGVVFSNGTANKMQYLGDGVHMTTAGVVRYAQAPYNIAQTIFTQMSKFTICMRYFRETNAQFDTIIDRSPGVFLLQLLNNSLKLVIAGNVQDAAATVPENQKVTITYVFDGDANTYTGYLGSTNLGTITQTGNIPASTQPFRIGFRGDNGGERLDGRVYEMLFFTDALDQTTILDLVTYLAAKYP